MRFRSHIDGARVVDASLRVVEERCADLTRPLGRLGAWMERKNARILRSGERGIRSRGMSGLAAKQTYRVTAPVTLEVGANKVYAGSTNYGPRDGAYYPVTADSLAIPILDNLTAAGRPRYVSPRDVPGAKIVGVSRNDNLLIGTRLGTTKKGKARTRSKFRKQDIGATILRLVKIFFVLVPRSPLSRTATAFHWCTFDPPDHEKSERYIGDWILRGR